MIVKVRVSVGKEKSLIVKNGKELMVNLKSVARDGKANLELVRVLKKYFNGKNKIEGMNVRVKDIKIIKGLKSRDKIVEVNCY